jgi:hypothetical protein
MIESGTRTLGIVERISQDDVVEEGKVYRLKSFQEFTKLAVPWIVPLYVIEAACLENAKRNLDSRHWQFLYGKAMISDAGWWNYRVDVEIEMKSMNVEPISIAIAAIVIGIGLALIFVVWTGAWAIFKFILDPFGDDGANIARLIVGSLVIIGVVGGLAYGTFVVMTKW